jgi:hypothetical protein
MRQGQPPSRQPDNTIPIEPDQISEGVSRKTLLRRYNEADRKRRAREPLESAGWERARDRTCSRYGERTRDFPRGPEQPCRRTFSAHRSARGSSVAERPGWASEAASAARWRTTSTRCASPHFRHSSGRTYHQRSAPQSRPPVAVSGSLRRVTDMASPSASKGGRFRPPPARSIACRPGKVEGAGAGSCSSSSGIARSMRSGRPAAGQR